MGDPYPYPKAWRGKYTLDLVVSNPTSKDFFSLTRKANGRERTQREWLTPLEQAGNRGVGWE